MGILTFVRVLFSFGCQGKLTIRPVENHDYVGKTLGSIDFMSQAFVYILTNKKNTVIYTGVTNDLTRRVAEHKAQVGSVFTSKYHCSKLIYYEDSDSMFEAISREKQIKNRGRQWKVDLISAFNPGWFDLSSSVGVTNRLIESVRTHYNQLDANS